MIIDIHRHILPLKYAEFFQNHCSYPQVKCNGDSIIALYGSMMKNVFDRAIYSVDGTLSLMDKQSIDIGCISPQLPDCTLLGDKSHIGASILNEALYEAISKYPDRLRAVAALPYNQPEKAIEEAHRIKQAGFTGVLLCSNINNTPVDLDAYRCIYQTLAELDLVIFLHPSVPEWASYIQEYTMIPMLGYMMAESIACMRLILSGILEKNPGLKVIHPHCGGILPYLQGRIRNQTEVLKRGMDHATIPPIQMLKSDQIYYDLAAPDINTIRYIAEFAGTDKLMFGTDSPWINAKDLCNLVATAFPDKKTQEKLFSANAKRILNI